jgi:hypothetical protein
MIDGAASLAQSHLNSSDCIVRAGVFYRKALLSQRGTQDILDCGKVVVVVVVIFITIAVADSADLC